MKKTFPLLSFLFIYTFSLSQTIQLVKEIGNNPDSTFDSKATQMAQLGNRILFFANDGTDPDLELWQTDGTTNGTMSVEENCGTPISNFANLNDTLYWLGAHNQGGEIEYALWKIGTKGNATKVVGFDSIRMEKTEIEVASGYLFWINGKNKINGAKSNGIWQSDGTAANTVFKFKGEDFYNGIFRDIKAIKDTLFFAIEWDTSSIRSPFNAIIDIYKVADDNYVFDHRASGRGEQVHCAWRQVNMFEYKKKLGYVLEGNSYCGYTSHLILDKKLSWVEDHAPYSSFGIKSPKQFGSDIYFYTYSRSTHTSNFVNVYDGADNSILVDLETQGLGIFSAGNDNLIFFSANKIWNSDGTVGGTKMIAEIDKKAYPSSFFWKDNQLYFVANQNGKTGFWKTDGTTLGTSKIIDIPTHPLSSTEKFEVRQTIVLNNKILFVGNDGVLGNELWELDLDGVNSTTQFTDNQQFMIQKVYPNPFFNQLNLEVVTGKFSRTKLEVFNSFGQPIFRKEFILNEGLNTISLDLKNEVTGFMMVKMSSSLLDIHPYLRQIRVMKVSD